MQLAHKNNWALTINFKDGGFGELVGVFEDGSPMYYRTYNKGGVSTIYADLVHTGGAAGLDLNGEDMIVGVWDGNTVRLSHELFEGRAIKKDNQTSFHYHSTHVTGTAIGSADVNEGKAIGVAPKAKAHTYDWGNDYIEMIEEAEDGLLMSNHSYGLVTISDHGQPLLPVSYFGQYMQGSAIIDAITYELEYYLPVFAAGNDRDYYRIINPDKGGYDLLTNEGTAKNNLVVGSIYEIEEYINPSRVMLSSFSNFGPTDDGRVKPDITAKGHGVYSALADNDSIYGSMNGTSMSAPSVTGGLALLQQHANNLNGEFYRSATMRGLIAHTATKAGAEGNPNYRFGWGVMNVAEAVDVISENGESTLVLETELEQGQNYLRTITASEVEDIVATIAWTDLPGAISSRIDNRTPVLVNDLDIRIVELESGTTYYPYILNPDFPTFYTSTGDNFRDNIEKIEVVDTEGMYNVMISHKNNLEEGIQKYSLILSGIKKSELYIETYENNAFFCEGEEDEFSMELLIHAESDIENTIVTIENAPQGLNTTIDDSDLANGIVLLKITGISDLVADTYLFEIKAVNGSNEAKFYPTIAITEDKFEGVELLFPGNGDDKQYSYINFRWEPIRDNRVVSYTFELAFDQDFEDIVIIQEEILDTSFIYSNFERDKDYYWRVKAVGVCGEGEYGETFILHTYDLSIDDHHIDSFVIYPNPATDKVSIDAPTLIKEVKVMNILGQEVMVSHPNSENVELDINGLPSGTYLLRISDDEASIVKKIIKR